jgi:putative transcriptional regulator
MSDTEHQAVVDEIAANPRQGDEIRASGGVRKVRFAGRGKGKSGGYRVVTAYFGPNVPVYLVAVLSKGERGKLHGVRDRCVQESHKRNRPLLATENDMKKAADRIIQGLREAAAHARGDTVAGLKLHIPRTVNVFAVRRRTGLSQAAFSRRIGVSPGTLRNWEQGRRKPEGPARVLLALLERNPRIVEDTLGG